MTKKKRLLRNEKLRVNRASGKKGLGLRIRPENEKIENHSVHSQKLKQVEVEEKPKTGKGGR